MPNIKVDELGSQYTKLAQDVFYVAVGAGVIAFQKLQVQRQNLTKDLIAEEGRSTFTKASGIACDQFKQVQQRLVVIEDQVELVLDKAQGVLPSQARVIMQQSRDRAKAATAQIRQLLPV